jgi:eukaryotic-like serine/threonine-protein kinase
VSDPGISSASGELADDETRQHLQHRLLMVFTVLSGVSAFYAFSPFIAAFAAERPLGQPLLIPLSTLVIALSNGALALRLYRGKRKLAELWLLDAAASALTCWMIAGSLTQVRPPNEASISLLLGLTYVMMARALLLPSSTRRTLVVCTLAVLPGGLVATWLRVQGLGQPVEVNDWLSHGYVVLRNCAVTTFLAALASSVIYGLRKRVREIARVGQYVLREKVGEGGMGVVYRATHALLRRDTAVKLLLPNRVSPHSLQRFEREVKLTAQLTHQNTVAVFDYGRTPDGVFYYAMEYLEGGDLEQLVAYMGPIEPARAIWILEQVCRALGEAHALGLVHRDIKPSNVIICERGREGDVVKVLDFGLVMELKGEQAGVAPRSATLEGTPLYIAPESIASPADVDARSDIYSLGAVAYFLLTGRPPFSGSTVVEVCAAHLHAPPHPPSEKGAAVSSALDAVVLRCLAKQPAARHASALELRDALLACPEASAWNARAATEWWQAHRERFTGIGRARRTASAAKAEQPPLAAETQGALRIDLERRARNG